MQVFIIGSPLETAMVLDKKRLNKQIIECKQILKALKGETKAWANHPCTIQYRGYEFWLRCYTRVLEAYRQDPNVNYNTIRIKTWDYRCRETTPSFHTQEYLDNMKRRLYTKNNEHYKQFAHLGESYENWYWVDNKWKIYKQK